MEVTGEGAKAGGRSFEANLRGVMGVEREAECQPAIGAKREAPGLKHRAWKGFEACGEGVLHVLAAARPVAYRDGIAGMRLGGGHVL